MKWSRFNFGEILFKAGIMINNSLGDEQVKNAVAGFGYPEEKLNEGATLLSESASLVEVQKKEGAEVSAAQKELENVRKQGHTVYMDMLGIARIVFKRDVQATATLELNGRRATTISGWLKQVLGFYHALLANESWKTGMAVYGQTEEKLTAAMELAENVSAKAELVKKEMGDAQNATQERDLKFEELIDWLTDYEAIARIALADSPQLLEKLGIVVKS